MNPALSEPRLVGTDVVFRTPFFSVAKDRFEHPMSRECFDYYRIDRPDGLILLALTGGNEIILVRQYRPALQQFTLELPCGTVDPGESPVDAANREFYEETGYRCSFERIGTGRIMMNRVSACEYCFFGRNAIRDPDFVCDEEIAVELVKPSDFQELVLSGRFEQLATLGTILLARWKLGTNFV